MTRYALTVDGLVYIADPRSGVPYTLVSAMQAARGTRNATVVRGSVGGRWTLVVDKAGTQDDAVHVSTGHRFRRRPVTGQAVWGHTGWNLRRHMQLIVELLAPVGQCF